MISKRKRGLLRGKDCFPLKSVVEIKKEGLTATEAKAEGAPKGKPLVSLWGAKAKGQSDVSIFGRSTPVELEYWQVEKI